MTYIYISWWELTTGSETDPRLPSAGRPGTDPALLGPRSYRPPLQPRLLQEEFQARRGQMLWRDGQQSSVFEAFLFWIFLERWLASRTNTRHMFRHLSP